MDKRMVVDSSAGGGKPGHFEWVGRAVAGEEQNC